LKFDSENQLMKQNEQQRYLKDWKKREENFEQFE